mgnify:CR=1 FL=1
MHYYILSDVFIHIRKNINHKWEAHTHPYDDENLAVYTCENRGMQSLKNSIWYSVFAVIAATTDTQMKVW